MTPSPPSVGTALRDQERSTFTLILEGLLAATPGALAAVLVDYDGETVDYVGNLDPFELKVAAAHWQIVLSEVRSILALGSLHQVAIAACSRSYVLRAVHEGYALLLVMPRRAAFAYSERAFQEAVARCSREAGWPTPQGSVRWFHVEVEAHPIDRFRPSRVRVAGEWRAVEVIGAMVGLGPHEHGYRVRLPSGVETILVRERVGHWFADDHLEQAFRPRS